MLMHPILDNLQSLRFFGMLKALEEQMKMSDIEKLSFEERFGLLVDREMADRQNRRFSTRLRRRYRLSPPAGPGQILDHAAGFLPMDQGG